MKRLAIGLAVAVGSGALTTAPAAAYDMDCKVILCLAGGFPSGCGDAHSYMIKRLKKLKPPFGICVGGGSAGDTYDVPVKMYTRHINPSCGRWVTQREGGGDTHTYCASPIPGRQEGIIRVSIPQDGNLPDYTNEYIWYSRRWEPHEN
jgi:hypothetical protein